MRATQLYDTMKSILTFPFLFRLLVAIILVQTLYFKFTAAPESVYIFTAVGMEPWGRVGTGVVELITAILIMIPKTAWLGGLMALGTITGALFFHATVLGIQVQGDGGLLFTLACIVFVGSLLTLWFERKQIPFIGSKL